MNAQTFGGEWKQMSVLHWYVFHLHAAAVPLLLEAGARGSVLNPVAEVFAMLFRANARAGTCAAHSVMTVN